MTVYDVEVTVEVLKQFPGVGAAKAESIIEVTPNLGSLMSASVDDIAAVKGISDALASQLIEWAKSQFGFWCHSVAARRK